MSESPPPEPALGGSLKSLGWWILALAVGSALVTGFIFLLGAIITDGRSAGLGHAEAESVCDWAVKTALSTKDPLTLQRAEYFTEHLACAVEQRLPKGAADMLARGRGD